MRLSAIESDRGVLYTLACATVAFGIVVGAVLIPVLYAFGYIAGMLFLFLSAYLWIDLAFIVAAIVYYMGVFVAAVVGQYVFTPITGAVDSAIQFIGAHIPTITLPTVKLPTVSITW